MALSADRSRRRAPRIPPPAAAPSPAPAAGEGGVPESVAAPPSATAGSAQHPVPPPPVSAAPLPVPELPAPPDASSTVQLIPLLTAGTGTEAPSSGLPAPGANGPAAAAEPPDEPAPPAAGPATPPAGRKKPSRCAYLILLALLLALAGALYYLFFRPSPGVGTPPASLLALRSLLAKKDPPSPASRLPSPASPLSRPVRQARQVVADVQATRAALPADAATNTGAAPPPASRPPSPASRPPSPSQVVQPPRRQDAGTPGKPAPAVVEWPEVEISAVVGGGRRGSAIVNGRLLVVGEENDEGLLLDRIESQTAVLRFKGETRRFIVRRRD